MVTLDQSGRVACNRDGFNDVWIKSPLRKKLCITNFLCGLRK